MKKTNGSFIAVFLLCFICLFDLFYNVPCIERKDIYNIDSSEIIQEITINKQSYYIINKDTINKKSFHLMNNSKFWNNIKETDKETFKSVLCNHKYPYEFLILIMSESSLNKESSNGKYFGLTQQNIQYIRSLGFTIDEYLDSIEIQLYVADKYKRKYCPNAIMFEELCACWLNSNWEKGDNIIISDPKVAARNCDENKDKKITLADLRIRYKRITKQDN